MKMLLLVCCFVFFQPMVAADENQEFAEALGWEKKWNKITLRSTEKYLTMVENGPFANLSSNNKTAAISELRESLDSQLNWVVVGQDFSQGIVKHCDPETLDIMTRLHNKERVANVNRKAVAQEYSKCAKKGFLESMELLKQVVTDSRSEVDALMQKYQ